MIRSVISSAIAAAPASLVRGVVVESRGTMLRARISGVAPGDLVRIESNGGQTDADTPIRAQVVAFGDETAVLSPLSSSYRIVSGAGVELISAGAELELRPNLAGCVVDCHGRIIERIAGTEGSGRPIRTGYRSAAPPALERTSIEHIFETGIRALDCFATIGNGQRLGIFAEPGVGKSTLLAAIARHCRSDLNVIALVGERGREIPEFVRETLSEEAMMRTVVVASTSDEPAVARILAIQTATRIAELARDAGQDVLLLCDSLTRLCRAYRELGLACGETPVRRGYPSSVFAELPRLLERAGVSRLGSITAFYTVLTSGDLDEDPMVEEIKGLLDGHIVLRRSLADRGHYPAIDVLRSLSRLQGSVMPENCRQSQTTLRAALSRIERGKDLVALGAEPDSNLAAALAHEDVIEQFVRQDLRMAAGVEESFERLRAIARSLIEAGAT